MLKTFGYSRALNKLLHYFCQSKQPKVTRMASTKSHETLEPEWFRDQNGVNHFLAKTNVNFETYYSSQKICGSQQEWEDCLAAMRRPLPQSLRVNSSRPKIAKQLIHILQNFADKKSSGMADLEAKPWSKDQLIWQVKETSRWDIKQKEEMKNFHNFIFHENQIGNISRQELVSMVPVLLLGIKSDHIVLDMCSSPGSKTKQVVEWMLRDAKGDVPSGVIISNEMNASRCDRLAANLIRMSSPAFMLVNHDGQNFPEIYKKEDGDVSPLRYDRIVCDVPCSGDGTIRKNPTVWKDWSPGSGNSRHFIQFNLAERGVELLSVGGIFAYSSCSINPIENEAVLARLIRQSKGALELVDCRGKLPGLEFAEGQVTWKVFDSEMNEYNCYKEVPERFMAQLHPGMFPSPENVGINLDRCMRFLPHHNDDGGFFVALIKKIRPLPWETLSLNQTLISDKASLLSRRARNNLVGKENKPKNINAVKVDRKGRQIFVRSLWQPKSFFAFLSREDNEMKGLLETFGIPYRTDLFYSATEAKKKIYMTNPMLKSILQAENKNLNIYHAGSKMFVRESRSKSQISHRILPSTGFFVSQHQSKRCLDVSRGDLLKLLTSTGSVPFTDFSEGTGKKLEELSGQSVGPVKVVFEDDSSNVELLGFVGERTIMLDSPKSQIQHGLRILGEYQLLENKCSTTV